MQVRETGMQLRDLGMHPLSEGSIFNVDPDEVRSLIFKKEDVNAQDNEKRTPLHAAAYLGDAEIIELLILSGMFLKRGVMYKSCLCHIHFCHSCSVDHLEVRHIEVVKLLASHGAEVACKDKKSYTPLHAAASSGMISVVKYLLDLGVDINEPNAYGNTPLHVACYNGQDVVVNELIECGANVNQVNEKGFAPLHFTAASRHGALCLELLVCNGADVNIKSKDGKTPLHMTAIHGRFSRSQAIIENGAEIDCEDKNGNTPLHIAARYGHELLINTLITNRADTAKRGVHGMFPLHLAALSGFSDCCRKLLSSGFDIDTPDDFGRTCLHAAAAGGNLELFNNGSRCLFALVGSGASVNDLDERGCTPLHYAAASDTDGKCLEYLLRNDANPGIRDNQGYNAVHYASAYGHRLCLELIASETPLDVLMETSGTDILNDSDVRAPVSPLHLSAYHGHHHAMEVLVQSLLDLDVRNSHGRTPLDLAAFKGHVECVDVLINQGASILVKDFTLKRTPIHAAGMDLDLVAHKSYWVLYLLHPLFTGIVCVDIQDGNGQTPLMLSVLSGHTDCVYSLLNKGANVEAKDKWGRTALHRGAVTGHEECVEALLQHSATFLVRDCKGRTPVHLSAACGHIGVLGGLLHAAQSVETLPVLTDNQGYTPLHWGHETSALLVLEKITDRNLINATNAALQTPLHVAARNGLTVVVQELLAKGASVLAVDENGYTPALACAPNKDVADCLALILATMMPVPPCAPAPTLPFSAINHYTTSPSKSVTFDSLPVLRGEHSSYCSFNNISHQDNYKDEELNDSDSETY
uniref:Ankyrin repeat domain 28 n=1 Tax=Cyclopterus lumpus TaxID=8103 RepID=A0A8C2X8N2_CYCLU